MTRGDLYLGCIALVLAAGCEGLTSSAEPLVSVLKRTNDGCFSLMTSDTPVDPALGASGECAYLSEPELFASVDLIEAIIDYGPDVPFSGDTAAPPPTVTVTVDGQTSDEPIVISAEHRVDSRAYFVATFHAPGTQSTDVRIAAGVNSGFATEVPTIFSILPTPVTLSVLECTTGTACTVTGGVGRVQLDVSVPGDQPQAITLLGAIDGVAQADPLPEVTTEPVANHTEVTAPIPVPVAAPGATWTIAAQLGSTISASMALEVVAPTIDAALSCGAMCSLTRGQAVGLTITAPAGISPLVALASTSLGGVPQLVAAQVPLVEAADGTATGQLALTAPATAGTWQIDVSVAGYAAPTVVTTVH